MNTKAGRATNCTTVYPGPGGEGYLDIINRLRPVIVELERMTDHVLLVGHRSVARVLLAYFRGLKREEVRRSRCSSWNAVLSRAKALRCRLQGLQMG